MQSFERRLDADKISAVFPESHSVNDNLRFPRFRNYCKFAIWTAALLLTICAGMTKAEGTLSSTPGAISFGPVAEGVKYSQTIQLRNTGTASLTIASATVSSAIFGVSGVTFPKTLAAGAPADLTVSFTPTATGSVSGTLTLKSSASNATLTVAMTGLGIAPTRSLTLSAGNAAFGNEAVGGTATQTITVKNSGNESVTISSITESGTGFSTSGGLSGATIAAGQSGTLLVTFAPQSKGLFTGTVTVNSNASNSPSSVATTGTGVSDTTHTVKLNWNASTTAGVAGYHVYRSTASGSAYTRISGTLLTVLDYTDASVTTGATYYYVVTAVLLSGAESTHSNQIEATIP